MGIGLSLLPTLATQISVGEHVEKQVGGLTFNMDTIWATALAVVVVIALALVLRRQVTSGVPGRLQAAWEIGLEAVTRQVDGSIGPRGASVIPLATALFVFIFVCNIFTVFGLGARYEWLLAPNADINLPLAMALFVIGLVHVSSIRARGPVGYARHYLTQPFPMYLLPFNLFINLVEEIAKPITLALRLFGNLLSGTLMLSLIAYLGVWKIGSIPVGNVLVFPISIIWKLFDLAIGGIQAFIFALLTILYFDVAMSTDHEAVHETVETTGADLLRSPEVLSPVTD
ncbi:MAG TPA: F0F1 ATP synthase subunit A [Acidimicrobiales bacterium]|nr:F0F1 ATP synthase subunit A [Acidimicrobiales bacterium]